MQANFKNTLQRVFNWSEMVAKW